MGSQLDIDDVAAGHPLAMRQLAELRAALQNADGSVQRPAAPLEPERDVLADIEKAAARKWAGNPAAQRAGLFARAAAEIKDLRRDLADNEALRERMADRLCGSS